MFLSSNNGEVLENNPNVYLEKILEQIGRNGKKCLSEAQLFARKRVQDILDERRRTGTDIAEG